MTHDNHWLGSNRRPLLFATLPPLLVLLVGAVLLWHAMGSGPGWLIWSGWILVLAGGFVVAVLGYAMSLPRLAYQEGYLLVYVRPLQPARIPIEVVECFFFGQGPSQIPGFTKPGSGASQTSMVVVRLAESATEFHRGEAHPVLGTWCGGYINLRGTWCEPLSGELVNRLNQRLLEAHREVRRKRQEAPA